MTDSSTTAFAIEFRDRVNGHKPKDIHTEIIEARKFLDKGVDSAFGGELTEVYLINNSIATPLGVSNRSASRRLSHSIYTTGQPHKGGNTGND